MAAAVERIAAVSEMITSLALFVCAGGLGSALLYTVAMVFKSW